MGSEQTAAVFCYLPRVGGPVRTFWLVHTPHDATKPYAWSESRLDASQIPVKDAEQLASAQGRAELPWLPTIPEQVAALVHVFNGYPDRTEDLPKPELILRADPQLVKQREIRHRDREAAAERSARRALEPSEVYESTAARMGEHE